MQIESLTRTARALPAGPVHLRLYVRGVDGAPAPAVRLEVDSPAAGRIDDVQVELAVLAAEATARAFPAAGGEFPVGTMLQLSACAAEGDDDETEFWCAEVDASLLESVDLLVLTPVSGRTSARVPASAATGARPDDGLPGAAQDARYAWRRALQHRQATRTPVRLRLVIDHSASMRRHVESGLTQRICEIVLGLAHEVMPDPAVEVHALAGRLVTLEALTSATQTGFVRRNLTGRPYGHGLDLDTLVGLGRGAQDVVTYLLTDEPRAGIGGPVAPGHEWHVIALARSAFGSATDEPIDSWEDELAALGDDVASGSVSVTSIDPAAALTGEREMARLVLSLIPAPARGPAWSIA